MPDSGDDRHVRVPRRLLVLAIGVVALFWIGTVWLLQSRLGEEPVPAEGSSRDTTLSEIDPVIDQYSQAVSDFERLLEERRGDLDPETLSAVEENLETINKAIEQTRQALEEDPADPYLTSHLAKTMQQKLDVLRQAAMLTQPAL